LQETAYILRHATPQSLVLIDELGRATSTTDGLGVAWAVAEALAATGARTLLATHFAELAELANIYPQCRAWHFSVNTSNSTLDYTFELKPGRCKDKHYGLALAASVAFPQEALERAKTVVESELLYWGNFNFLNLVKTNFQLINVFSNRSWSIVLTDKFLNFLQFWTQKRQRQLSLMN